MSKEEEKLIERVEKSLNNGLEAGDKVMYIGNYEVLRGKVGRVVTVSENGLVVDVQFLDLQFDAISGPRIDKRYCSREYLKRVDSE